MMAGRRRYSVLTTLVVALTLTARAAAGSVDRISSNLDCHEPLRNPCCPAMRQRAPEQFSAKFGTNYGPFVATCIRQRAPVWVDRVYNLMRLGYYDANFIPRVLNTTHLKIAQFGTAGDPTISNIYNYTTSSNPQCAILKPQPPNMPYCDALKPCAGFASLSNTFGTISMSTGQDKASGQTWNATAELFINLGDNSWLDKLLFVPICTVDTPSMERTVRAFPSFGELADMGGPGPSLGMLYELGNHYIEANKSWATMAQTTAVRMLR